MVSLLPNTQPHFFSFPPACSTPATRLSQSLLNRSFPAQGLSTSCSSRIQTDRCCLFTLEVSTKCHLAAECSCFETPKLRNSHLPPITLFSDFSFHTWSYLVFFSFFFSFGRVCLTLGIENTRGQRPYFSSLPHFPSS